MNHATDIGPQSRSGDRDYLVNEDNTSAGELDETLSLADTLEEDHDRYADVVSDLVSFEESHAYDEIKATSTAEELHNLDSSPETTVS